MKHLTVAALCLKLQSHHTMDRAFAAEELGRRRASESVGALCALLLSLSGDPDRCLVVAPFAIKALAAIGDPRAARPILEILRMSAGVMMMPPEPEPLQQVACRALVALRATAMLPALRELQLGRTGFLYRDLLARAVAELGGADEVPFLFKLLQHGNPVVRAAACSAFGHLRYPPALPALEELSGALEEELRWSAIVARAALGQPAALTDFRDEARRLGSAGKKQQLLYVALDQEVAALAAPIFELANDPRWICTPSLIFYTLEIATRLGSEPARQQLRAIEADEQASPCARAHAAGILVACGGQLEHIPRCFAFLRDCTDPRKCDPRDDRRRRAATQLDVIEALERFGRDYPEHRGLLADGLYEILWRDEEAFLDEDDEDDEGLSYVPDRAGQALYTLTGAASRPELERWKRNAAVVN